MADVFVASKAQPWHQPAQISKWGILTEFRENAGFLEGADQNGTLQRFSQPLIVARLELPSRSKQVFVTSAQMAAYKALGEKLGEFMKKNPRFDKALAPYLTAYNENMAVPLENIKSGKTIEDGEWVTPEELAAKRSARAERAKIEAAEREKTAEANRERAEKERAERAAVAEKEREQKLVDYRRMYDSIKADITAGKKPVGPGWQTYLKLNPNYADLVQLIGKPDTTGETTDGQTIYSWYGKVEDGTKNGTKLSVVRSKDNFAKISHCGWGYEEFLYRVDWSESVVP